MKCIECKNLKKVKTTMFAKATCCDKGNPAFEQKIMVTEELLEDCFDFDQK